MRLTQKLMGLGEARSFLAGSQVVPIDRPERQAA